MKFRNTIGLLIVLIVCSCFHQTSESGQQLKEHPNEQLNLTNGLRIENGINRGSNYTDLLGTPYGIRNIQSFLNNNSMIRIIYSWKVEPEKLELFIETWKRTTNRIHEEVEGARGSFMLQNDKDSKEIKTIARWEALNDWKKFWHESKHSQMGSMHDLGERVSVEIFREVDDFTR